MGAKFTSRINQWSADTIRKTDVAMLALATTIHRDAGTLAPVDSGNLASSGRIAREGIGSYRIIFGGGSVPYAKRRHYENFKNPQTLLYLKRAGDSNSRNYVRYLKGQA